MGVQSTGSPRKLRSCSDWSSPTDRVNEIPNKKWTRYEPDATMQGMRILWTGGVWVIRKGKEENWLDAHRSLTVPGGSLTVWLCGSWMTRPLDYRSKRKSWWFCSFVLRFSGDKLSSKPSKAVYNIFYAFELNTEELKEFMTEELLTSSKRLLE